MNAYEKKRKAAMIAVAYYIEQEKANAAASNGMNRSGAWAQTGKEIAMNNRYMIQRRGRLLRSA
jgi:hypothetical protein